MIHEKAKAIIESETIIYLNYSTSVTLPLIKLSAALLDIYSDI